MAKSKIFSDATFKNVDCEMDLSLTSDEIIPPTPTDHQPNSKRSRSPDNESDTQRIQKINKIWPNLPTLAHNQSQDFPGFLTDQSGSSSDIILIKPLTSTEYPNLSSFFKNDIKLAKFLDDTVLGRLGIVNIKKNLDKDILVVFLKNQIEGQDLEEVLNLEKIGSWNVDCRLPQNRTISYGVIPLELEASVEEMETYLKESNQHVLKLQRLLKGRGKNKTLAKCVKVTFNSPECPSHIYIGYSRVSVNLFIDSPWQCFNCQRFYHNAANCHSKARCLLCGQEHNLKDCPGKNKNDFKVKCVNCHGTHAANYGGCKKFKEAKKVERIRAEQNISFSDALRTLKGQPRYSVNNQATKNQSQIISHDLPRANSSQLSLSLNTQPSGINTPSDNSINVVKSTMESGCQTDPLNPMFAPKEMLKCFAKIVTELIKSKDIENLETQCNQLIIEAFDVDISEPETQSTFGNSNNVNVSPHLPIIPETLSSLSQISVESNSQQSKINVPGSQDQSEKSQKTGPRGNRGRRKKT